MFNVAYAKLLKKLCVGYVVLCIFLSPFSFANPPRTIKSTHSPEQSHFDLLLSKHKIIERNQQAIWNIGFDIAKLAQQQSEHKNNIELQKLLLKSQFIELDQKTEEDLMLLNEGVIIGEKLLMLVNQSRSELEHNNDIAQSEQSRPLQDIERWQELMINAKKLDKLLYQQLIIQNAKEQKKLLINQQLMKLDEEEQEAELILRNKIAASAQLLGSLKDEIDKLPAEEFIDKRNNNIYEDNDPALIKRNAILKQQNTTISNITRLDDYAAGIIGDSQNDNIAQNNNVTLIDESNKLKSHRDVVSQSPHSIPAQNEIAANNKSIGASASRGLVLAPIPISVVSNIIHSYMDIDYHLIGTAKQYNDNSGVSSGDNIESIFLKDIWTFFTIVNGRQSNDSAISGFDSKILAYTLGIEYSIHEHIVAVIYSRLYSKFNFRQLNIGDKMTGATQVLSLYNESKIHDIIFQGIASIAVTNFHSNRNIANSVAKGQFKNQSYNAEIALSKSINREYFSLIPKLSIGYANYKDQAYSEFGVSMHSMFVKARASHDQSVKLELQLIKSRTSDTILMPFVKTSIEYHLHSKSRKNINVRSVSFVGDFIELKDANKPYTISYQFGTGIIAQYKRLKCLAIYNYYIATKYHAHKGTIRFELLL